MTAERFDRVENNVILLSEAVAELRTIAKVVVAEHGSRIKELENDVDNIRDNIRESCDIKTRETEFKISEAINDTKSIIATNFRYTLWMAGSILGLGGMLITGFIMYASYLDGKASDTDDKISKIESVTIRNNESIGYLKDQQTAMRAQIADTHYDIKSISGRIK